MRKKMNEFPLRGTPEETGQGIKDFYEKYKIELHADEIKKIKILAEDMAQRYGYDFSFCFDSLMAVFRGFWYEEPK
jgi:hypothetical protein